MENKSMVSLDTKFPILLQPKVDVHGNICGAEALVRWSYNDKIIPPSEFINIAEDSGMIDYIGFDVCSQVAHTLAQLISLGIKPIPLSVNLSPMQLSSPKYMDQFVRVFARHKVPLDYLEIELLESFLMETEYKYKVRDLISVLMLIIKHGGVKIAMDDFGSGHSSLCRLAELPVSILKVDRRITCSIDQRKEKVIAAVIGLAHSLGMSVVIEGVETKEQADVFWNFGADLIQGYYYFKPLAVNAFIDLLVSRK